MGVHKIVEPRRDHKRGTATPEQANESSIPSSRSPPTFTAICKESLPTWVLKLSDMLKAEKERRVNEKEAQVERTRR